MGGNVYFNSTVKDCVLYGKIYEDSELTVFTLTTKVN